MTTPPSAEPPGSASEPSSPSPGPSLEAPPEPPPTPTIDRRRLSLLASLFLILVVVIVWQRHAILVPIYAGLLAWLKSLFKALTPKLLLVFVKYGVFIKLRQLTTALFTRFLVFSHRPWRRRVSAVKALLVGVVVGAFQRFLGSPLWFRAAVALVVLALTATSAYAFVALLIIPRAIVEWIKVRAFAFLKKLGMTRGLDTLWKCTVPEALRHRWYLFAKWRLGRQQVLTSQRLHRRVERRVARELARRQRTVVRADEPLPSRADRAVVGTASAAATSAGGTAAATVTVDRESAPAPRDRYLSVAIDADDARRDWARSLPPLIERLCARWNVVERRPLGEDGHDGTASWVAACTLGDGRETVLKIAFPHDEGRDEIPGLAFWAGEGCVALLESEPVVGAMLLERCLPGTALRGRPEPEQDEVIAALLKRLWRSPRGRYPFRPLADQSRTWCAAARERAAAVDPVLDGALAELEALAVPRPDDVLLATDLHAGNVLAATRAPWLVIDPKPYVGDPAYDLTQHLLNGRERLRTDPVGASARLAARVGVDAERVRRWLAARLVVETDWYDDEDGLARAIAVRLRGASSAPGRP